MSIGNVILQRPAGHLITDTGAYDADGRVVRLLPKVAASDRYRFAFTGQGQHETVAGLWQEIEALAVALGAKFSGVAVADRLGELFFASCLVQGVGSAGRENCCSAQYLWYDEAQARTRALLVSNGLMDDGLQPFQPIPVAVSFGCGLDPDAPFGEAMDPSDPSAFDIRRDGLALAAAQRRRPWSLPGSALAHYVAGDVLLTTVDASGARTVSLGGWQDPIGERVDPDRRLLQAA